MVPEWPPLMRTDPGWTLGSPHRRGKGPAKQRRRSAHGRWLLVLAGREPSLFRALDRGDAAPVADRPRRLAVAVARFPGLGGAAIAVAAIFPAFTQETPILATAALPTIGPAGLALAVAARERSGRVVPACHPAPNNTSGRGFPLTYGIVPAWQGRNEPAAEYEDAETHRPGRLGTKRRRIPAAIRVLAVLLTLATVFLATGTGAPIGVLASTTAEIGTDALRLRDAPGTW